MLARRTGVDHSMPLHYLVVLSRWLILDIRSSLKTERIARGSHRGTDTACLILDLYILKSHRCSRERWFHGFYPPLYVAVESRHFNEDVTTVYNAYRFGQLQALGRAG